MGESRCFQVPPRPLGAAGSPRCAVDSRAGARGAAASDSPWVWARPAEHLPLCTQHHAFPLCALLAGFIESRNPVITRVFQKTLREDNALEFRFKLYQVLSSSLIP